MTFFSPTTFIGIDPTAGQRPITFVALDEEKQLLAIAAGDINSVLAFAAGQESALVAICSPRRPNQGVMQDERRREALSPVPRPGRWQNCRQAEYELRQHQIHIYLTDNSAAGCPRWMQTGFRIYQRLDDLGYAHYPHENSARQTLEVYPHAAYTVLLGQAPYAKQSLEGRLQRQLLLYEHEINVGDPMRFFEEITRHRLLNGLLPTDEVLTPDELDALIAAYTAWRAAREPASITGIGDPNEGQIILPTAGLHPQY